jgi:hypothetical protein
MSPTAVSGHAAQNASLAFATKTLLPFLIVGRFSVADHAVL